MHTNFLDSPKKLLNSNVMERRIIYIILALKQTLGKAGHKILEHQKPEAQGFHTGPGAHKGWASRQCSDFLCFHTLYTPRCLSFI